MNSNRIALQPRQEVIFPSEEKIAEQKAEYFPAFDYLRIILATVVAAVHAGLFPLWPDAGNLAVQVFFALSGWLIGGILLRSTPSDLPRFYFNRSARIWVPYFIAIGLLVSVSLLKDHVTGKWIEFVIYKLTFVYDFFGPPQIAEYAKAMPLQGTGNHFWSICAEEQFYLIAPLVILLLPIGRSAWFWLGIFLVAMLSPLSNLFASIALGVSAVILRDKLGDWHRSSIAISCLSFFAAIVLAVVYFDFLPYRIGAPLIAIAIVLALAQPGTHSKAAEFLGGISFPLYLNHWLGLFLANAIFGKLGLLGSAINGMFGVMFAVAISSILYVIVDRNVRANRQRFFSPTLGRISAITGYALVSAGMAYGLASQATFGSQ